MKTRPVDPQGSLKGWPTGLASIADRRRASQLVGLAIWISLAPILLLLVLDLTHPPYQYLAEDPIGDALHDGIEWLQPMAGVVASILVLYVIRIVIATRVATEHHRAWPDRILLVAIFVAICASVIVLAQAILTVWQNTTQSFGIDGWASLSSLNIPEEAWVLAANLQPLTASAAAFWGAASGRVAAVFVVGFYLSSVLAIARLQVYASPEFQLEYRMGIFEDPIVLIFEFSWLYLLPLFLAVASYARFTRVLDSEGSNAFGDQRGQHRITGTGSAQSLATVHPHHFRLIDPGHYDYVDRQAAQAWHRARDLSRQATSGDSAAPAQVHPHHFRVIDPVTYEYFTERGRAKGASQSKRNRNSRDDTDPSIVKDNTTNGQRTAVASQDAERASASASSTPQEPQRRGRRRILVASALTLVAGALIVRVVWFQPEMEPAPVAPEIVSPPPFVEPDDTLYPLYVACREHMENRRYTHPEDNNALECYQQILRFDPGNPEAESAMASMVTFYTQSVERALLDEDWTRARDKLDRLHRVDPDSARPLMQRLAQWGSTSSKDIQDLPSLLAICRAHMEHQRYTHPDDANALGCYRQVLQRDPENDEAKRAFSMMVEFYELSIEQAVELREWTRARRAVKRLRRADPLAAVGLEQWLDEVSRDVSLVLSECQEHMDNRRYTHPPDNNALICYKEVLRRSPGNMEATANLKKIADWYVEQADWQLEFNNLDKVRSLMERLRKVDPNHPEILRYERVLRIETQGAP